MSTYLINLRNLNYIIMEWLEDLFWNPSSVAHIVFLYAFVIALGVYLGKVKIFGVSLGVTFVFAFYKGANAVVAASSKACFLSSLFGRATKFFLLSIIKTLIETRAF